MNKRLKPDYRVDIKQLKRVRLIGCPLGFEGRVQMTGGGGAQDPLKNSVIFGATNNGWTSTGAGAQGQTAPLVTKWEAHPAGGKLRHRFHHALNFGEKGYKVTYADSGDPEVIPMAAANHIYHFLVSSYTKSGAEQEREEVSTMTFFRLWFSDD